jgi:L-glutamine-phosphate cytidylyltransferase
MKAVILAAGRGSRLADLTGDKPKCLVNLDGMPLLKWQLLALRKGGVSDITVVRGYRKECIEPDGFNVLDNPRWAETNMVETLCCADAILSSDDVIVSYSDIAYRPSIVKSLLAAKGDLAITYDKLWRELWALRFEDPLKDAETFKIEKGVIKDIGRKTDSYDEIQGQYMGLLKFTPTGWRGIRGVLDAMEPEARKKVDMTGLLRRAIGAGVEVRGCEISGGWCEVDAECDIKSYLSAIAKSAQKGGKWLHDWREE